jgi:hypothetical protein
MFVVGVSFFSHFIFPSFLGVKMAEPYTNGISNNRFSSTPGVLGAFADSQSTQTP